MREDGFLTETGTETQHHTYKVRDTFGLEGSQWVWEGRSTGGTLGPVGTQPAVASELADSLKRYEAQRAQFLAGGVSPQDGGAGSFSFLTQDSGGPNPGQIEQPSLRGAIERALALPIAWPVTGLQPGHVESIALTASLGLFGQEFDWVGYFVTVSADIVIGSDGQPRVYGSVGFGGYFSTSGQGVTLSLDSGMTNGPDSGQYPGLASCLGLDIIAPPGAGGGVSVCGNDQYGTVKAGARIGDPGISGTITVFSWTSEPLFE